MPIARITAVAASNLSRLLHRGDGGVIGGAVALRLAPEILTQLGRGRVLACVSGTNGKTTVTRLSALALSTRQPVISNTSGANLTAGLVTTLCRHPTERSAVLEVDEMYLAAVVRSVQPRVVVLLNLSRDQLDRTAEPHRLATSWRAALSGASCTVVANCDDPRVAWAAAGAARVLWVSGGQSWTGDSYVCPRCGDVLRRGAAGTRIAAWHCPGCRLARPAPDAVLTGSRLTLCGLGSWEVSLSLPGRASRANAAMAAMAAHVLGVPIQEALTSMQAIDAVEGRYGIHDIDGVACRLILAKNPAGWAETLEIVEENDNPLVLAVNAHPVDGVDTSWFYDVPFERIAGRQVCVIGDAAVDLSLRLSYGYVPHQLARAVGPAVRDCSSRRAIQAPSDLPDPLNGSPRGCIDVVADYSNFRRLRSFPRLPRRVCAG